MAKTSIAKRDEQYELSRRALIKWTVAAGAALGVSRSKIFEILEGTAGKGVAFAAATNATMRSVHLEAGNGGLAWAQTLWPMPEVALANNPNFAYQRPGQGQLYAGTDKPLAFGPDTPLQSLPAARQMTCFLCGNNETHTGQVQSNSTLNGANIHAIAATLQAQTPMVIPHIVFGNNVDYGTAPGAPSPAQVTDAASAVNLFNSAASRAGGLLAMPQNASLYKAQYDAFAQLNRAAARTTQKKSFTTASGAASFLGTNLASKLTITDAERAMYGINAGTPGNIKSIAENLIFAAKSFQMGLTNSVTMSMMNDDPHGAFADGRAQSVPPMLKAVFDGFIAHLGTLIDTATSETLVDTTMFTIAGDTPKDALQNNGWPDGTNANSNMIYVWGNGHLKTGWFGQVKANGNVEGFNATGGTATYNGGSQAKIALASVAYAIAKRDDRAISQFANGITIAGPFGRLKDI